MGRPRLHENNAAKQRAYRERKKETHESLDEAAYQAATNEKDAAREDAAVVRLGIKEFLGK